MRNSIDRKSTRLNSSHLGISYAVFCLKRKWIIKPSRPDRGLPWGSVLHSSAPRSACARVRVHGACSRPRVMRAVGWLQSALYNDAATTEIYTLSLHDALPI